MIESSLFKKYQEIGVRPSGALFDLPLYVAKDKQCPGCGRNLRELLNKSGWMCRSKTCGIRIQTGRSFFITTAKIKG